MSTIVKRGLGKGLSALMSDSYSQAAEEKEIPQDIVLPPKQTLPVHKIRSGKFQPRGYFNESALQELADSIGRNGVMQPILVRKSGEDAYEIIAGERRWRASKIAGLSDIPVVIRTSNDEETLEIAIIENIQREDLNALEEATGYQRLMDEFGYTQENIAAKVNKSRSHIANLLRLLVLPQEIQELFLTGKLTMGHARALIGVENALFIAKEVIARGYNVRQTEKIVNDSKNPAAATQGSVQKKEKGTSGHHSPATQPHSIKDPDILALEETLSENLGLKVSINDRGQTGEIMISYESLEQLDEILRRLGGSA